MIRYLFLLILILTGCAKPGLDGHDGRPCVTTKTGHIVEIACPGQEPVMVNDGSDGAQGVPGAIGETGAAGTAVVPIQLCPGVPTYPTSFPESALCIGNTLYGVYDADGTHVFLAELPPGSYYSTSPDACTFAVGPNCEVTLR